MTREAREDALRSERNWLSLKMACLMNCFDSSRT